MIRAERSRRLVGLWLWRPPALAAVLALGFGGGVAERAAAHAVVLDSTPGIDSVLTGPDVGIELHFNSRIDAQRSKLSLFGADGQERELAPIEGGAEGRLSARATGLAPGAYRLRWQVLAVDGHITRGDIPFRVAAP